MASSPPDDESFAPGDVEPRHLALKFDPPTLVLEYCRVSRHKLYHHRIRLKHLSRRSVRRRCCVGVGGLHRPRLPSVDPSAAVSTSCGAAYQVTDQWMLW